MSSGRKSLRTKVVWIVRVFALGSLIGGFAVADAAGRASPDVAQQLILGGGVLLGLGAVLLLGGPRSDSERQTRGARGPTVGQGCLISIGGLLLGVFSCMGAVLGYNYGAIEQTWALVVAGCVIALGGFVVMSVSGSPEEHDKATARRK